jgi:hypothetical protein
MEIKEVATSMDDFFGRLVFGVDSADFLGVQWLEDLKNSGVI